MSKKETDILLIRKYLNGELDSGAMHQFEKRAQDDPFLMDALEGYESNAANQQANLDELGNRLQQRITAKQRRIIPYRLIAIAASVLIVFTVGWLWLSKDHQQTLQTNAKIAKPAVKHALTPPTVADTAINNQIAANTPHSPEKLSKKTARTTPLREIIIAHKKAEADNMIASAEPAAAKADTVAEDTTPLNEMVVMNYNASKKKDVKGNVQVAETDKQKTIPPANTEQALQSKVAGVTTTPAESPFSARQSSKIVLQGRIVDKTDGMALPGVSVRVPGTSFGAVTDNNGKFSIPVDSNKSNIVIAYIGYNTLKINTRNRDSLKTIGLEPNHSSLNEVVVVGYGSQKKDDEPVTAAHPKDGWHSFKKYLNENAVSPDGKTGIVKLSFTVDPNGNISEVVIIKGLSALTNKKAIDLINNGPDWTGSSNGKTEQVKIRVRFSK